MTGLKSIGLLLCCLNKGGVSLRSSRKASDDAGTSANGLKYPAREGCMPRYGYDVARGCAHPTPFEPVDSCERASFPDACLQISRVETVRGYMRNIRSSSDYSSLTNIVVQAEGSGWGVKVSAGFEYLKSSQVSEKSMAFFIGAGGEVHQQTLHRPSALKLTESAKELIGRSPREFIDQFGIGYIYAVASGGSFLGSVTLSTRQTSDSSDVEAFADVSVNKGFFSAKGAAEFRDKEESDNLSVETYINAMWAGGTNITANFTDSESLGLMFQEWDSTWRASPKPLSLVRRPWVDSVDVQKFVNLMADSDRALFLGPMLSTTIAQEISNEDIAVAKIATSVDKALSWREVQRDARACLRELSRDIAQMKIIIETLDEADVVVIQEQFMGGDYSWFTSTSFQDRYEECERLIKPPGPSPTPAPTPAPKPALYLGPLFGNGCEGGRIPSKSLCRKYGQIIWDSWLYRKGTNFSEGPAFVEDSWANLARGCSLVSSSTSKVWLLWNTHPHGSPSYARPICYTGSIPLE